MWSLVNESYSLLKLFSIIAERYGVSCLMSHIAFREIGSLVNEPWSLESLEEPVAKRDVVSC